MGNVVHVLVSTYNRPAALALALHSIRAQTISADLDVTVCDDCSDAPPAVPGGFALLRGPKLDAHRKATERLTMGWLLNRAIRSCGDPEGYYAYLTDDAVWAPAHLERLRALLDQDPGCAVAYSRGTLVHNGRTVHIAPAMPPVLAAEQVRAWIQAANFAADHNTVMHRGALPLWPEEPRFWHGPDVEWRRRLAARPGTWRCSNEATAYLHNGDGDLGAHMRTGLTVEEALALKDGPL